MYGYSRVEDGRSTRPMSIDFSDLSFPQSSKPKPHINQGYIPTSELATGDEQQDGTGESFGAILSKSYSVSSAYSSRTFRSQSQRLQSNGQFVVKRATWIRRSSSVRDGGYCKIHDQPEVLSPPPEDPRLQGGLKKRKAKILKACKKLLGFH